MTDTNKIAKQLAEIIKSSDDKKTSGYDTPATVTRIEGSTAWVHIPGGVDETPVKLTVNAIQGDTVQVRVAGGRAWITGNASAPPTDDRTAFVAVANAEVAHTLAQEAQTSANEAYTAAESAVASAAAAQEAAETAEESAVEANIHANGALNGLSEVEKVLDILNWIAEHGEYQLTQDTAVVPGKTYFVRSGESEPYTYTPVENPQGNPSDQGYYELTGVDEGITNYISTHLALIDDGLYVTLDNSGYKVKVSNTGVYIINPAGTVISTYSATTTVGNVLRNNVHIDNSSINIRYGNAVLSRFSTEGIEIGEDGSFHITIDPDSYDVYMADTRFFQVGVIADGSGYATLEKTGIVSLLSGTGEEPVYGVYCPSDLVTYVSAEDITPEPEPEPEPEPDPEAVQNETLSTNGILLQANNEPVSDPIDEITIDTYNARRIFKCPEELDGHTIIFTYKTRTKVPGMTLGTRASGTAGSYSTSLGNDNVVGGAAATASGSGLIANYGDQLVAGRYNIARNAPFIVGTGTAESPANGLWVDWAGNLINNGTITTNKRALTISDSAVTDGIRQNTLYFSDSTSGNKTGVYIRAYGRDEYGSVMLIRPGASLIMGGGEFASNFYALDPTINDENTYLGADGSLYLMTNGNTIANRKTWTFSSNGNITTPADGLINGKNLSQMVDYYIPSITTSAQVGQTAASQVAVRVNGSQFGDRGLIAEANKLRLYNYDTATAIWEMYPTSGTAPISVSNGAVSLNNSGVTAGSKGDTSNQTPSWGDTFKALSGTVTSKGLLSAFGEHTVKIPNATATTSASGLMSAADKTKVNKLVYAAGLSTANFGDGSNTSATYIWGNTSNKIGIGAHNNTDNKRYDLLARADHLALRNNTDDTIDWRLYPTSGNAPISVSNGAISISNATTSASGAMSAADKTKLNKVNMADGMVQAVFGDGSNTDYVYVWGNGTNKVAVGAHNEADDERWNMAYRGSSDGGSIIVERVGLGTVSQFSQDDFFAGNNYTVPPGPYYGYVTSSATAMHFFVPLPRSSAGLSVTIDAKVALIARGTAGYIDDSYNTTTVGSTSAYTWTCAAGTNGVRVTVTKSSALSNVTNNTPISVQFRGNLTFRFS